MRLMVIYIDVLVFTNIIINYCILSAVQKFLHIRSSTIRILLASFVSALFSLTSLATELHFLLSILLKIVCAVIMCFIAFMRKDITILAKSTVLSFIFSMVLSASMLLYCEIAKPRNVAIVNDSVYIDINPIVLIAVTIAVYLIIIILQRIFRSDIKETDVQLKIQLDDEEFYCTGRIDTGNNVVEPFSGAPVIIAEKSVFNNIRINKPRVIPYRLLNGSSILYATKAKKIHINNKEVEKEVYVALFDGEIDKTAKAIINSEILR